MCRRCWICSFNNNWGIFLNYTLVAIPYSFHGAVLDRSKVSEALFDALYRSMGRCAADLAVMRGQHTVFRRHDRHHRRSVVAAGPDGGTGSVAARLRPGHNGRRIICSSGYAGHSHFHRASCWWYNGGLTGRRKPCGELLLIPSQDWCCPGCIWPTSPSAAASIPAWVHRSPPKRTR